MASELTRRAMLVELHIKHWFDTAIDKEVTREVADNVGVDPKVGKYTKNLLPKDALKPIKAIKAEARSMHMELTMPWDDSGVRLLPVDLYDKYQIKMREKYEDFNEALRQLMNNFTNYQDEARDLLGAMFKETDYPPLNRLSEKFEFSWQCMPVPDATHFVADLPVAEAERIKNEIESQLESRIKGTVHDLYQRLGKAVTNLASRMEYDEDGNPKSSFQKSTIDNLREMCDVLPQLNITHDAELANLCAEVKQAIVDIEVDELRPTKKDFNAGKFQRTHDRFKEFSTKFAGYFGNPLDMEMQASAPADDVDDVEVEEPELVGVA